jgi:hypothetical protein
MDLSTWLATPVSESISGSVSYSEPADRHPAGTVKIRVKDWLGEGVQVSTNPIWESYGEPMHPSKGLVRADLSADMVEHAGIYEVNWAILNEQGHPVVVNRSIMSVERSLFPSDLTTLYKNHGPPTLQEVRMLLMDSSANENLLLDDIEFKDEQIMLAMTKPIQTWNETPPPIEVYTTRNFPFRGAWAKGVAAELHLMAANHYRRNRLQHSAGGVTVDDKNKEREYLAEGMRLKQEYEAWLSNKKVQLNIRRFCGSNSSEYSFREGW